MPAGKTADVLGDWSSLAARFTTLLAVAAIANKFLPQEWTRLVRRACYRLTDTLNPYVLYAIPEFAGDSSAVEQLYEKAKQYLNGRGTESAHRLRLSLPKATACPTFSLVRSDTFRPVKSHPSIPWS